MTHQIKMKDLWNFKFEHLLASSSKEDKQLVVIVHDWICAFEVRHLGEKVLETKRITKAVNKYNSI